MDASVIQIIWLVTSALVQRLTFKVHPPEFCSLELALCPTSRVRRHLHRSQSPVLPVVVPLVIPASYACPLQCLVIRKRGQDTKDDRDARVQLNSHERMRDRLADVFKMHCGALDKYPNRDHRVERLGGHNLDYGRRCRWTRAQGSQSAQEVGRCRTGLYMRARDDPANPCQQKV